VFCAPLKVFMPLQVLTGQNWSLQVKISMIHYSFHFCKIPSDIKTVSEDLHSNDSVRARGYTSYISVVGTTTF
jgi:hypothetical protein